MRRGALAFSLILAASSPAAAQAPQAPPDPPAPSPAAPADPSAAPADPPPPEQDPLEVRVIGERADDLQKVPGSGTLVTAKEITRTQPADAAEILRRVPGVTVRQDEGGGLRLDVGVRGLDPGRSRRVLMLEDGIPIAINPYAEADMYYVPPIERMRGIEVVKGSGSILFGPQTIGGVINFITLAPPSERRVVLQLDGGQRGYFRALASYGDAFERARYVVQVFHKRGDGIRHEAFHATNVLGKIAIDTSERGELTLKIGVHDEGAVSGDAGLTRAMYAEEPGRQTLTPHDSLDLRRYEVSLIHEHRFGTSTKVRTLLYGYITDRIWNRQDYTRVPSAGAYYERIVGDPTVPEGALYFFDTNRILDRYYEVVGVEPRIEQRFRTSFVEHTVDFGARFLYEAAHIVEREGDTPTSRAGALIGDEAHRTFAFAGYLQDRIAFRDYLMVTPGVRVEHARYRREVLRMATNDGPRDVDRTGESESTGVVPGIGIIAGLPEAHGFAGFHVGYAPPRIATSINPMGQSAELDAERNLQYEVGGRFTIRKALRAAVTGFLSNFSNQIVSATNPVTHRIEQVNGGQTRHLGAEADATVSIGDAAKLGMVIDLTGRYTLSHATFLGGALDGNTLPYAPTHAASVTLDADHPLGAGAQISWTYVGSQFSDDENTMEEDVTGRTGLLPGYYVFDIGARYRHKPTGLTGSVTVKNLLDQTYISARRPEGIFASGFRQVNFGLKWEYQ
jgi:Fe(3+) dicitrate transport protein